MAASLLQRIADAGSTVPAVLRACLAPGFSGLRECKLTLARPACRPKAALLYHLHIERTA